MTDEHSARYRAFVSEMERAIHLNTSAAFDFKVLQYAKPGINQVAKPAVGRDRDHLPVEVILQHRRLTAPRPRAAAVPSLTQSAFVDEDDRAMLFLCFF